MMYRVMNYDLNEVIEECKTLKEAKEIQLKNYFFNNGIEKYINGKWVEIEDGYEE